MTPLLAMPDSHPHFVDNPDGNMLDAELQEYLRRGSELKATP